jgi:tetratricopeptide (TPR) repeat protein
LEDVVRKEGLVIWRPTALFFKSALACAQSDVPEHALRELERAVEEFRALNIGSRRPWILAVFSDALLRSGRLEEAEVVMAEALTSASSQRWCLPEVLRIHASVFCAQRRMDAAEATLTRAIEVAHEIGGLSWRLRAAIDLARLLLSRAQAKEARALLLPIYTEFTEGFATRDLVAAAELIAACGGFVDVPQRAR